MTVFILKIIACITMLLDHIKYGLPETSGILTLYFGFFSTGSTRRISLCDGLKCGFSINIDGASFE